MPTVNLVFLAAFRDVAGTDRTTVEAATPRAALAQLGILDALVAQTPIVAVNQRICDLDTALSSGDEVALMPPMTGG
ncbi:MoaD/ThiS family protein [Litorivicinus lipolyticus]|uniref:MoaD/ThiS family protein n=1 Tax=Litorivicinus lipolyticus TaxID=418701 RepID=UPI003B5B1D60